MIFLGITTGISTNGRLGSKTLSQGPAVFSVISIIDERFSRSTLQKIYLVKINAAGGNLDVVWHDLQWIVNTPGGTDAMDAWKLYKRKSRVNKRRGFAPDEEVNTMTESPTTTNCAKLCSCSYFDHCVYSHYLLL
jgi:hypothetical protein